MNKNICMGLIAPLTLIALPAMADTWAWGRLEAYDRTEGTDITQTLGNLSAGTAFGESDLWINADYARISRDFGRFEYSNFDLGIDYALSDQLHLDLAYSILSEDRTFPTSGHQNHFDNAEIGLTWGKDNWFLRAGFAALDEDLPDTAGDYWSLGGGIALSSRTSATLISWIPLDDGSHVSAFGLNHAADRFSVSAHYVHASEAARIFNARVDMPLNEQLDLQGFLSHYSWPGQDLYTSIGAGLRYQFAERAAVYGAVEHIMPDDDTDSFASLGIGIDFALGDRPARRMNFAEQVGKPVFLNGQFPGAIFARGLR